MVVPVFVNGSRRTVGGAENSSDRGSAWVHSSESSTCSRTARSKSSDFSTCTSNVLMSKFDFAMHINISEILSGRVCSVSVIEIR